MVLVGMGGMWLMLVPPARALPCTSNPLWDCQHVVQDTVTGPSGRNYATVSVATDAAGEVEVAWENFDRTLLRGILFGRRRTAAGVLSPTLTVISNQTLWLDPMAPRSFLATVDQGTQDADAFKVMYRANQDGSAGFAECDATDACPGAGGCPLALVEARISISTNALLTATPLWSDLAPVDECVWNPGVHELRSDFPDDVGAVWTYQDATGTLLSQTGPAWEALDDLWASFRDDDAVLPTQWLNASAAQVVTDPAPDSAEHHATLVPLDGTTVGVVYDDWSFSPHQNCFATYDSLSAGGTACLQVSDGSLIPDPESTSVTASELFATGLASLLATAWIESNGTIRLRVCENASAATCEVGSNWDPTVGSNGYAIQSAGAGDKFGGLEAQWVESKTAAGVLKPTLLLAVQFTNSSNTDAVLLLEKSCIADPLTTNWGTGWTSYNLLPSSMTAESFLGSAKHGNLEARPGSGTAHVGFIFENAGTGVDSIVLATRTYVCG